MFCGVTSFLIDNFCSLCSSAETPVLLLRLNLFSLYLQLVKYTKLKYIYHIMPKVKYKSKLYLSQCQSDGS